MGAAASGKKDRVAPAQMQTWPAHRLSATGCQSDPWATSVVAVPTKALPPGSRTPLGAVVGPRTIAPKTAPSQAQMKLQQQQEAERAVGQALSDSGCWIGGEGAGGYG